MPSEHFSLKMHKRHRKALSRRLDHLQTRIAGVDPESVSFDISEAAALTAAISLMDAAIEAETARREAADANPPRRFKVGDRVRIVRKVEVDSKGRDCCWIKNKTALLGRAGVVEDIDPDDLAMHIAVRADGNTIRWWYSPEALDLINAADEGGI